tara:strand:+ start:418 stop:777 length:360 start_codon:yes stop_codon:yes gene_type:complete
MIPVAEKDYHRSTPFANPEAMRFLNEFLGDGEWHSLVEFYGKLSSMLPVHFITRISTKQKVSRKGRDESQYWDACCKSAARGFVMGYGNPRRQGVTYLRINHARPISKYMVRMIKRFPV